MINDKILINLFDKYKLKDEERKEFYKIIKDIYYHPEFQKRLTREFMHHGSFTLGTHIIKDAIVTYKLSKKYEKRRKKKKYNTKIAVIIAMLHDLYTESWQNSDKSPKHFCNRHGFRHPIEAVINAYNWYPELFKDEDTAKMIIDGVIHHMYPFPVCKFDYEGDNINELRNFLLLNKVDPKIIELIIKSSKRMGIFKLSFARSRYKEGRIMSRADKKVAIKEINNFRSAKALITGTNKSIKKKIDKKHQKKSD